jgi:hypothetical protein
MKKELKITPKKQNTEGVEQAEMFANTIIKNLRSTENKGNKKRVNFDMPTYLYDLMMEKADKRGDSMRNYFVNLVRKDVEEIHERVVEKSVSKVEEEPFVYVMPADGIPF